jgi:hypothetical protein
MALRHDPRLTGRGICPLSPLNSRRNCPSGQISSKKNAFPVIERVALALQRAKCPPNPADLSQTMVRKKEVGGTSSHREPPPRQHADNRCNRTTCRLNKHRAQKVPRTAPDRCRFSPAGRFLASGCYKPDQLRRWCGSCRHAPPALTHSGNFAFGRPIPTGCTSGHYGCGCRAFSTRT